MILLRECLLSSDKARAKRRIADALHHRPAWRGQAHVGVFFFITFLFIFFFPETHLPLWESGWNVISKNTGRSSRKIVRQAVYSERPTRVI
jgi:hypothetical protein